MLNQVVKFSKKLPGIPTLPFIGNLTFLLKNKKNLPIALEKVSRQLKKNFGIWFGPIFGVFIVEPDDIEIILTSPLTADKEPTIYEIFAKFLGPTSLQPSKADKTYRSDKKLIMSIINSKYVFKFIDTFNYHANVLVNVLENKVDKGEFDVLNNMSHCIADIVFETIFGIPGKNQQGSVDKSVSHIERVMELLFQRALNPLWHFDFLFNVLSKHSKEWYHTKTGIDFFLENLIAEKTKNYPKSKDNENDSKFRCSLFDQLFSNVEATQKWTKEETKTNLFTLFLASHDTLHGTISFSLLMIAMHQEVQDKIRQEVNEIVGDELINENVLNNLTYIDMTLKEIIRLFPIAPLMGRVTSDDLKLTSHTVPKGCSIALFALGVHKNPKYWIEPDKFNPERFSVENSKNRPKYAYIPFSGGARMCPGYKYGLACLKTIISHVIRNYELSTNMKMSDLDLYMNVSIHNRTGYPVSLKKLKS
ncbi:hypothetical protein HCN44_002790 [Aphidius gifuensis]|uniref:Cytochrome P450 n=1 Tax=Aphidius gifuensis TaxID=684658 RepID=A0A834XPT9_APHGI|nr:hypothetical protein HCN44_002790 [Aphidius gifuensis]